MNKGFTMVELLAAIIILSGIMLIAVPTYGNVSHSIKISSLENKTNAISASMLKFANLHLLDEVKPAGENCSNQLNCCMEYDLYDFIIEYGIYSFEKEIDGENIIIDPVTNSKLNGCVRVKYNRTKYNIETEFIKDRILTTPKEKCEG